MLVAVVPSASADTQSELQAARDKLAEIERRIQGQRAELERLNAQVAAVADRVNEAEVRLEGIRAQVAQTRAELEDARARYEALDGRLASRIREVYMQGPATGMEVVLGATSFGDLLDRIEYSSRIAQADADLMTGVENLRNELEIRQRAQRELAAKQEAAVRQLRQRMAELDRQFDRQRSLVAAIQRERADALDLVSRLKRRYQQELQASIPPATTSATASVGAGPFQACPVGFPRALTDSFGAPRYGGGYHLHAGVDIMAPTGTPIYATFSGTASNATNGLGGISVIVSGAAGWTYNAHLSRLGQLGSVQAGEVIGYVGATGDTSTPHNHFEWHPNVIPSSWPASAYGYSVVGDALNPYPILATVC